MKNTTPPESSAAVAALALAGATVEVIALALRPLLAHAVALALTIAGYKPRQDASKQQQAPSTTPTVTAPPRTAAKQSAPKATRKPRPRKPTTAAAIAA